MSRTLMQTLRDEAAVTLWTDFTRAGGTFVGEIEAFDARSITVRRVSGDHTLTLGVARATWTALAGRRRMVVRVTWPDGLVEEWRVARVQEDQHDSAWLVLTGFPPFSDLVTRGAVLRVVNGEVLTTLTGEMSVSAWIDTYVLPHAAATRLGMTRGTIAPDPVVALALDAPSPGELVLALAQEAQLEYTLTRLSDGSYRLDMGFALNSTLPVIEARVDGPGRNVLTMGVTEDDAELATAVFPVGAEDADGDRATVATMRLVVTAISSPWVELKTSAIAGERIILVDSQWVGAWVLGPSGFAADIVEARASDGYVRLSTTAGLSVGDRVALAMDALGAPLTEVWSANAIALDGARVVKLPLTARGEANELRNGDFADGLTGWTGVNQGATPSHALIARSELGQTVTGEANGARAAGTGTGTAFSVRGLPANSWVRQSDRLDVAGVTYTVTTDEVPSTAGALSTVGITPGLAAALADDTAFTLERRDRRQLTTRGAWHPLNAWWPCQATNADFIADSINPGRIEIPSIGWALPATADMLASYYEVAEAEATIIRAGRVAVGPRTIDDALAATHPTWTGHDVHTSYLHGLEPGFKVRINTWAGLIVGTTRCGFWSHSWSAVAFNTAARTAAARTGFIVGRVIAAVDEAGGTTLLTLEADIPTGFTSVSVSPTSYGHYHNKEALKLAFLSNASLVADATALELTWQHGTNTINLSGSHGAGATSLTFKANGALATTNVANGGTFAIWRNNGGTLVQDTLTATGAASWASAGTISIPVAATANAYAKGAICTVNGVTGYVTSALAAGATSIPIQAYHGPTLAIVLGGSASVPRALLSVPGNTLYAAASVQADGAGVAAITLKAANPNAITDGQSVEIVRPSLLDDDDETTGFVLRLLGASYTPPATAALPALAQSIPITVPTGQARTVTVFITVALSAGTYALGSQPTLLLLNGAGTVLARQVIDDAAIVEAMVTPTVARLVLSTTLLASDTLTVRVLGGAGDTRWMVVKHAMLAITADDAVPFTRDSHANTLGLAAASVLALRADAIAAFTIDLVTLRRWTDAAGDVLRPQAGQLVREGSRGVTRRVLAVEQPLRAPDAGRVELGTVATDLSRRVATLLGRTR